MCVCVCVCVCVLLNCVCVCLSLLNSKLCVCVSVLPCLLLCVTGGSSPWFIPHLEEGNELLQRLKPHSKATKVKDRGTVGST